MKTKELPFEQVFEAWENDKDGDYISVLPDENRAYYCDGGSSLIEIYPPKNGNIWAGIRAWQEKEGYFPNIWFANDHGNLSLYDNKGNYLGGIV